MGGLLAGALLALAARVANRFGARRRSRRARRALDARVAEVAEELVIAPLRAELDAARALQDALARAVRAARVIAQAIAGASGSRASAASMSASENSGSSSVPDR